MSPLVILASIATTALTLRAEAPFKPAEAVSVTDAFYTTNKIVPDAFVVLDLCLDRKGAIENVDVLRDTVSMAKVANSSVRRWKFRPATDGGEPVASQVPVVFVYTPSNVSSLHLPWALEPVNLDPAPAEHGCEEKSTGYVPAGILAAAYPDYPVNSVASGSVVIQVTIGAAGNVKNTDVLHPMPSFSQFALEALRKWRFQAAMLRGEPIESKVIVAFVFQSPSY